MHPLKDFKFLNFRFHFKISCHSCLVLVINKYRYGKRFSHRKVKISHCKVNPPIEYKPIIMSQLPHGEISKCKGQKKGGQKAN
jgi:hypothetical protein